MGLKAGIQLSVDGKGNLRVIDLVRGDVRKLNAETRKSRVELKKLNKRSAETAGAFRRLGNSAKIGAALFAAWKISTRTDQLRLLEARISRVTELTGDYNKVSAELTRIAFDNGIALKGTTDLFINLQRAAKDLGATNDETLQLTNTVQQLGVISAASTTEMKNSLRQFSQAMAGGIVRAEEWNSIVENTPEIANRIAAGMGKTVGELRKVVIEGKLLSEDVFTTLLKQSDAIQADFEKMPLTIGRASSRLALNYDKVLEVINKTTGSTAGLANVINDVALGLGDVADYIGSGKLQVDFRTWIEFADQVGKVADEIENLIDVESKLILNSEQTGLTLRDVFLDLPLYAKVAYNNMTASAVSTKERTLISFNTLLLRAQKIWLIMESDFSAAFHGMNISAANVLQDIGYSLADVFTTIGDSLKAVGLDDAAQGNYNKASQLVFDSTKRVRIASLDAADAARKHEKAIDDVSSSIYIQNGLHAASIAKRKSVERAGGELLIQTKRQRKADRAAVESSNNRTEQLRDLDNEQRKLTEGTRKNTTKTKVNTEATKAAAKAKKELEKSQSDLQKAFASELATLDRRKLALTANKNELLAFDLAQKTFGKNNLKFSQAQIDEIVLRNKNIVSLEDEKEKRKELAEEAKKAQENRDAALESMANERKGWALGFTLIKNLTVQESKKFAQDKKVFELQKKRRELTKKYNKEIKDSARFTKLLTTTFKGEENAVDKARLVMDGLTAAMARNLVVSEKLERSTVRFIEDRKALNKEIEYQIILNTQGERAARLYHLEQEYGSKQKAELILQDEERLEQLTLEGELYKTLTNAVGDFITGAISSWADLRKAITDPIKAQFNLGINKAISGGGTSGITGAFDSVKSLLNPASLIGNIGKIGSSITGILSGSTGILSGLGGLASGLGAIAGPVGLAVAAFSVLKKAFGGKARLTIGQGAYARGEGDGAGVRWAGAGFDNDRQVRTSGYGDFGVIGGGRTKRVGRLGGEFQTAINQTLDIMKTVDDAFYSLSSDVANINIKKSLEQNFQRRDDKITPSELAEDRFKLIIENTDDFVRTLIDTTKPFEQQITRLLEVKAISTDVVPALQALGFNLGKVKSQSLPATVSLLELAGGLEQLAALRSNAIDKLYTDEEKLLKTRKNHQKVKDDLNKQLGLVGNARIESANGLKLYIKTLESSGDLAAGLGKEYADTVAGHAQRAYDLMASNGELTAEQAQQNLIAAYESADAYAALQLEIDAANANIDLITNAFSDTSNVLSLINAPSLSAQEGLVSLKGGIEGLTTSMSGYISNILTQDEQKIYAQVSAAQELSALADDLGISASLLDTREEFKQLVSDANTAKALSTEAGRENFLKLLDASASVALLADSGKSLGDVLSDAPADILNFSSGVESVADSFEQVNTELASAVNHSADIASNINNIIPLDIHKATYERNRKSQEEVIAELRSQGDKDRMVMGQLAKSMSQMGEAQREFNNDLELERNRKVN